MATPEKTWPGWTRVVVRLAIFAALALTGVLAHHHDTSSHATGGPAAGWTAGFPLDARPLLHPGVDVYYFNDAVGHVTQTSVNGDKLVVRVAIDAESRAKVQAMDPDFQLYRDHRHHSRGWIALIPKDSHGTPMSAKQAARTFGRDAS